MLISIDIDEIPQKIKALPIFERVSKELFIYSKIIEALWLKHGSSLTIEANLSLIEQKKTILFYQLLSGDYLTEEQKNNSENVFTDSLRNYIASLPHLDQNAIRGYLHKFFSENKYYGVKVDKSYPNKNSTALQSMTRSKTQSDSIQITKNNLVDSRIEEDKNSVEDSNEDTNQSNWQSEDKNDQIYKKLEMWNDSNKRLTRAQANWLKDQEITGNCENYESGEDHLCVICNINTGK